MIARSRRKRVLVNSTHIARVGGRLALAAFQLTPPLGRSMMFEVAGWPSAPPYKVDGATVAMCKISAVVSPSKVVQVGASKIQSVWVDKDGIPGHSYAHRYASIFVWRELRPRQSRCLE